MGLQFISVLLNCFYLLVLGNRELRVIRQNEITQFQYFVIEDQSRDPPFSTYNNHQPLLRLPTVLCGNSTFYLTGWDPSYKRKMTSANYTKHKWFTKYSNSFEAAEKYLSRVNELPQLLDGPMSAFLIYDAIFFALDTLNNTLWSLSSNDKSILRVIICMVYSPPGLMTNLTNQHYLEKMLVDQLEQIPAAVVFVVHSSLSHLYFTWSLTSRLQAYISDFSTVIYDRPAENMKTMNDGDYKVKLKTILDLTVWSKLMRISN